MHYTYINNRIFICTVLQLILLQDKIMTFDSGAHRYFDIKYSPSDENSDYTMTGNL